MVTSEVILDFVIWWNSVYVCATNSKLALEVHMHD